MTILFADKYYYLPEFVKWLFSISSFVIIGYAAWWVATEKYDYGEKVHNVLFIIIAVIWVVSIVLLFFHYPNHYINLYTVQINEDYPFLEFYDNYEVVSKENYLNIFTVKELVK